jgi:hypothetical protein
MEQKFVIEHLKNNNPELLQFISPITDNDRELMTSFFSKPKTGSIDGLQINFEDSFEYIRLYFTTGRYQGFKYYDNENLIIFGLEKKKKPHFKMFKPLGLSVKRKLPRLVKALLSITDYPIHIVCLSKEDLRDIKKMSEFEVKNIKEFNYYIYDLNQLGDLSGNRWKNVRQKIARFNRSYPKLKIEHLTPENSESVVHFIGAWRRYLLSSRGHSYANLEKNKFAMKYYSDKNDFKNIWATIYKLKNRVVGVQLLYRLGIDSAAHAIGLADANFPGLAESTQVDIWNTLLDHGIRYINDGASWRQGLDRYKRKFNPVSIQTVFECKIKYRGN